MFQIAYGIFDNCIQSELQCSYVGELYEHYLKHKLQMGRNPVFIPFHWALAVILPWQRFKENK
jgi:hypothetical protein